MSHRPPLSGAEGPSSSSATSMAGPSSFGMNRSPTVSTASNPTEGTAPARNVSRYSQLVQLKMRNALLAVQAQQQQQQQQQGSAGSSSASSSNPTSASTLSSSSLSGMTACTSQPLRDLGGWSSASANDSSGRSSVLQGIAQEHVVRRLFLCLFRGCLRPTCWSRDDGPVRVFQGRRLTLQRAAPGSNGGSPATHLPARARAAAQRLVQQGRRHVLGG